MGPGHGQVPQLLVCPGEGGGVGALFREEGLEPLAAIRNGVRVVDHHRMGLFRPQVGEFLQHFIRGLKVQGRLLLRVLKAPGMHDDGPENAVVRL